MRLTNPYTGEQVEYPLDLDLHVLNYHIRHETPFEDRYREWAVSVLDNGDTVYIPYGSNRCTNIYIVSRLYINKLVQLPDGIYTLSVNYCFR